jgi:hypothetical protein
MLITPLVVSPRRLPESVHGQETAKAKDIESTLENVLSQEEEEPIFAPEMGESQGNHARSKGEQGDRRTTVIRPNGNATERDKREKFSSEGRRRDSRPKLTTSYESLKDDRNDTDLQEAQQHNVDDDNGTQQETQKQRKNPAPDLRIPSPDNDHAANLPIYPRQSYTERHESRTENLSAFFSNSRGLQSPYDDTEVHKISSLLQRQYQVWSRVPRLYIVLRTIDSLELLDEFIDLRITDY